MARRKTANGGKGQTKESLAKYQREYRAAHKQEMREYEKNRKAAKKAEDPEAYKIANRTKGLRVYGLTIESWDALFESQGRRCAICETVDSGGRWHTDHDDSVGKHAVRGILCVRCNIGLGQFLHNRCYLLWASGYLEQYEEKRDGYLPWERCALT